MLAGEFSVEDGRPGSRLFGALPLELLAEIFKYCLPSDSTCVNTSHHLLPPLTLTWVCRYWRNACLSLPRLWTDIMLGHNGHDPEGDARLLDLWISRSGRFPMSLKLNYELCDAQKDVYIDGIRVLIDKALTCIHRWRRFEIHALNASVLEPVFIKLASGAPRLECLGLSTQSPSFFSNPHLLNLSSCSSLQTVRILLPQICPTYPAPVMENLTNLELRFCMSIEDCLQWVDICPSLESLSARLFCNRSEFLGQELGWIWSNSGQGRMRHLRRLTHLELHGFSIESDLGPLIDVLDVPALKTLQVIMYDMVEVESRWTHILDCVRRSDPPLETLKISGTPMLAEDILECLQLLPGLTKLSLSSVHDADILIQALSVPKHDLRGEERSVLSGAIPERLLCPSLKVFDLASLPWSLELLASMVASRCLRAHVTELTDRHANLEELHVDETTVATVIEHRTICECLDQGLKIEKSEPDMLLSVFSSPRVVFV
ncbi:hypothetical protein DFH11DRAFT_1294423 [Phellopilus nigrolimitatus]|nr:hypothetical protein DFH11DRAFT_1294423 [Phellopilus nigrolimitatus]